MNFTALLPIHIEEQRMAFFGILIILSFSILLLAELLNELIEGDNYETLVRMIDKIDRWIDKVVER